jgi:hypothetical protein
MLQTLRNEENGLRTKAKLLYKYYLWNKAMRSLFSKILDSPLPIVVSKQVDEPQEPNIPVYLFTVRSLRSLVLPRPSLNHDWRF